MISNGVREEEIFINGLRTNYKIAGEGPAILVLHGWGGSSKSWLEVQKFLACEGYKVIVPDLPGFGKSITPPDPWELQDYINFILEFIKKMGLDDFYLLGHSFGGRISIKFVVRYPEKVKALILCASAGIKTEPSPKAKIIFLLARIGNVIFSPKYLQRFKDILRNIFYIFIRNRDYVKANDIMKESIKKILDEDLLPDLSKINVKTLLLWGSDDRMVPLKYSYIFKENIKGSKLEILPKIGHSPHLEIPEKTSEIILDFIK